MLEREHSLFFVFQYLGRESILFDMYKLGSIVDGVSPILLGKLSISLYHSRGACFSPYRAFRRHGFCAVWYDTKL